MNKDADSTNFLSRAYKIAKLMAVSSASLVAFVISLIALDVSKGHWWVDVKLPIYLVVVSMVCLLVLFTIASIWLSLVVKDALNSRSFYRNEAKSLKAMVSSLRDLAYNDSITGIPNSNKLKECIQELTFDKPCCLILLDLSDFGSINKKHNHWVGDEYLRRFAQMVRDSGRRNEYLFKSRPLNNPEDDKSAFVKADDEVRAFRKNSGGDEFFMLLEGTIIDGLGYLNRLKKRASEFERMAFDLMGERHIFGFCAGVVSVAVNESYESVTKRVSQCLGLALEEESKRSVYWIDSELPADLTAFQKSILSEMDVQFRKKSKK